MGSTKEIKFRDRFGSLMGRKNRMTFIIGAEPGVPTGMPAYYVSVCSENGEVRLSTVCHQYFHLDEAKKFCQDVADGKIRGTGRCSQTGTTCRACPTTRRTTTVSSTSPGTA